VAKLGRKLWTTKLLPSRLQAIHDAIDSPARTPANTLFKAMGLRELVTINTFRRYVSERRERNGVERANSEPSSISPSSSSAAPERRRLRELMLAQMSERVATGEVPDYILPKFMDALNQIDTQERAQERHEANMVLLNAKANELRAAVDVKSAGGTKSMTREDVYDLVDSIMRGKS
jgi:hypothetical protein